MYPALEREAIGVWSLAIYALLTLVLLLGLAWWVWWVPRQRRRLHALQKEYEAAIRRQPRTTLPLGNDGQLATQDVLGYGPVAQAITGLLLNQGTGAPYTVVISGRWGSGKSSVMAQVQAALEKNPAGLDFQTEWLNVWYYQSGHHLLAAFLSKLFKKFDTGPFRRRFRRFRFQRLGVWHGFWLGLVVFLLLPPALYLAWQLLAPLGNKESIDGFTNWWTDSAKGWRYALAAPFQLISHAPELLKAKGEVAVNSEAAPPALPIWGTLLTWLAALIGVLQYLRTNGNVVRELIPLKPLELATQADAGFRDKYRAELCDVLRYAPPSTRLVFFIDDVDRIPGPRVQELLESLNLLVETCREARRADPDPEAGARLYFVLGMYVPEVVHTLATALQASQPQATAFDGDLHAARYLEKLVDLVVPMPTLDQCTSEQVARLLFGEDLPASPPTT